jgi:hypothetical protein
MMPLPWLALLRRWWKPALAALLIATLAWQHHRLKAVHGQLAAERAAHALTIDRYRQAQDVAARIATKAKQDKEAANDIARHQADADLEPLRARYRAAVDKLRRQAPPAGRATSQPDLPGSSQAAQGIDGPGASAGVPFGSMIVTHDDALICADNTARLQIARDWALKVGD